MSHSSSGAAAGDAIPADAETDRPWSMGWRKLAVAAIVVAAPAWLVIGTRSDARHGVTFGFTGGAMSYVVPVGVCLLRVDAIGASGGPTDGAGAAGRGARATATIAVTPGETLHVYVGGAGEPGLGAIAGRGGWNGGGAGGGATAVSDGEPAAAGSGGGGATDIRRADRRIVVAAGGGGSAGAAIAGPPGVGGGDGGGLRGQDGAAALGTANQASGGEGGTADAGGAAGSNADANAVAATAGSPGVGGDGGHGGISGGGGGGGGVYGGGGGGSSDSRIGGGHGGGGSSFAPAGTTFRTGVWGGLGDGRAIVSYSDDERCRPQ
jgi:hypothetical protein